MSLLDRVATRGLTYTCLLVCCGHLRGNEFDGLARALSSGLSRRQTLTVLAAALSGSGLLAALPDETTALTRKQRRRCKRSGGTVCSAGTKASQCCATKNGADGTGTCVHGACSCDATQTYAEDNGCPVSADGRCGCHPYVGGSFPEGACTDRNSACDLDRPCDTNADCPSGSICLAGCQDLPDPTGHEWRRCSTPCTPA
jgi:hypothetical protein